MVTHNHINEQFYPRCSIVSNVRTRTPWRTSPSSSSSSPWAGSPTLNYLPEPVGFGLWAGITIRLGPIQTRDMLLVIRNLDIFPIISSQKTSLEILEIHRIFPNSQE